jgi:hypothetical protein
MRYEVALAGPVAPVACHAANAGVQREFTVLAKTNDLELAWLILNWAGECRLMPNEEMGVWDCTLQQWRTPTQVLQEGER